MFALLGIGGPASRLSAQPPLGVPLGVPIQLPTRSFFGVSTTVSVPDGGSISLGGNSGSAWSSARRGGFGPLFADRALGGTQFAHRASIHVQILSQAELEAELLSQLPPGRSLADYARPAAPAIFLHEPLASGSIPPVAGGFPANGSAPDRGTPDRGTPGEFPALTSGAEAVAGKVRGEGPPPGPAGRVDPNGSREVQAKADFMSRHIGRKKK